MRSVRKVGRAQSVDKSSRFQLELELALCVRLQPIHRDLALVED